MTVEQLIAELQQFDGSLPVYLASQYGDRVRTIEATEVEDVEQLDIVPWSAGGWKVPTEHAKEQGFYDEDDYQNVVVLAGSWVLPRD